MAETVGFLPEPITMQDVDVVMVSYRSGAVVDDFMKSLDVTTDSEFITVVDNHSDDNTVTRLNEHLSPENIQVNSQNVGYATAANQGAAQSHKQSHNRFISFINPDCFVKPAAIQSMCDYLQQHPEVGLVGCRVLNEDSSLQAASCRRLPSFWRLISHQAGLYRLGIPGINKPASHAQIGGQVEAVNGAFFVIRRRVFDLLNGFDEEFKLHFEDLDLFARCQQAGYQVHYLPQVTAIHLKGQSTQNSDLIKQWKRQGLKRYFKKHRPAWEQWLINRLVNSK